MKCPKCKEHNLIPRTHEKTGDVFMGCQRFPHCKYTEPIETEDEKRAGEVKISKTTTDFEDKLIKSFEEYLKEWPKYLQPSEVQRTDRHGNINITHTLITYIRFLARKQDGNLREYDQIEVDMEHYVNTNG